MTIKGMIGNQFHLSSTHRIKEEDRDVFYAEAQQIEDEIAQLDQHYAFLNMGMDKEAAQILEGDSLLSQFNSFGIAYAYMVVKLEQLGILYKPLIQCHSLGETHLIVVSNQDLIALEQYLNKPIEVELRIVKMGYFEMDETTIYQLVEIIG